MTTTKLRESISVKLFGLLIKSPARESTSKGRQRRAPLVHDNYPERRKMKRKDTETGPSPFSPALLSHASQKLAVASREEQSSGESKEHTYVPEMLVAVGRVPGSK